MDAEPVQGLSAPILQEWKEPNQRDGSEEAIQACYDLLSSGRPLLEILDAAKRLPGLKKVPQSNLGDEPADTQIREISGQARGISVQWEIAPVAEWAEPRFVESVAQTRPAPLASPPVTARPKPTQRRHARIGRPAYRDWELPRRLTDGF